MARIKIIADSASDIPQYLIDKYNIGYLPICVVMNDKVYYDRYDLDGFTREEVTMQWQDVTYQVIYE